MKTFIALSVRLPNVEDKYRGGNNNCQYTILVRAKSKREVARILAGQYKDDESRVNGIYHSLRTFSGIRETDQKTIGFCGEFVIKDIIKKDNTIYFHADNPFSKGGSFNEWVEYIN